MPRKKPAPPKRGVGRPKFEIDLRMLGQLAAIGATKEEAAAVMGCGRRTLMDRFRLSEETLTAWEDGLLRGRVALRRRQWEIAQGNTNGATNMAIHLGKHWLGQNDKIAAEVSGPNGGPVSLEFTFALDNASRKDD